MKVTKRRIYCSNLFTVLNLIFVCFIATLIHQVSGREACTVQVVQFPLLD